jgi:hypothetical protein
MTASTHTIAETPGSETSTAAATYPAVAKVGETVGLVVGAAVTLALRLAPSSTKARQPSKGDSEVPVQPIEGFPIERRHDAVYGPPVRNYAKTLPSGALHDLIFGFGSGARIAPSVSYGLEAKLGTLVQRSKP